MSRTLDRIKSAVREDRFILTEKARTELEADHLADEDIIESILNAAEITKTLRSRSQARRAGLEYLHVIQSPNNAGLPIYTKGRLDRLGNVEIYYILISSKRAE